MEPKRVFRQLFLSFFAIFMINSVTSNHVEACCTRAVEQQAQKLLIWAYKYVMTSTATIGLASATTYLLAANNAIPESAAKKLREHFETIKEVTDNFAFINAAEAFVLGTLASYVLWHYGVHSVAIQSFVYFSGLLSSMSVAFGGLLQNEGFLSFLRDNGMEDLADDHVNTSGGAIIGGTMVQYVLMWAYIHMLRYAFFGVQLPQNAPLLELPRVNYPPV